MLQVAFDYNDAMRLASIRKSKGLSQTDLAEMAGVEQPTISRIERGYDGVTLRILRQLADALGITVYELLSEDRNEAEDALLKAFRSLSPDRQKGWAEMASAFAEDRQ